MNGNGEESQESQSPSPKKEPKEDTEELGCIWDHNYTFCGKKVLIHEDYEAGLGGTLFDGALCLCNYIEHLYNADNLYFSEKSVLEVGAGCGLPGLLGYKIGANVIISDIRETLELLEENVESNLDVDAKNSVSATVLDWNNEQDLNKVINAQEGKAFNIILAADTVYHMKCVDAFISVLKRCSDENTLILFAHPSPRVKTASDYFWSKMQSNNSDFKVEKVDPVNFVPNYDSLVKQGRTVFADSTNGVFVLRRR